MGAAGAFVGELAFEGVVTTDERKSSEETAVKLLERAVAMKKTAATIDTNLKVAQHRDQLRYAQMRDGTYWRKLKVEPLP